MPVGARAVRLPTRDDTDRQVARTHQRADRHRERAGSDAPDLTEQTAALPTIRARPLLDGEHDVRVRHGGRGASCQATASRWRGSWRDSSGTSIHTCTRSRRLARPPGATCSARGRSRRCRRSAAGGGGSLGFSRVDVPDMGRIRPCAARAIACDGFGRGLALTVWRCG